MAFTDEQDRTLFLILTEHDVRVETRRSQRREAILGDNADDPNFFVWPDLSDIHSGTRRLIRALFDPRLDQAELETFLAERWEGQTPPPLAS